LDKEEEEEDDGEESMIGEEDEDGIIVVREGKSSSFAMRNSLSSLSIRSLQSAQSRVLSMRNGEARVHIRSCFRVEHIKTFSTMRRREIENVPLVVSTRVEGKGSIRDEEKSRGEDGFNRSDEDELRARGEDDRGEEDRVSLVTDIEDDVDIVEWRTLGNVVRTVSATVRLGLFWTNFTRLSRAVFLLFCVNEIIA
jgi:hypothetical protein